MRKGTPLSPILIVSTLICLSSALSAQDPLIERMIGEVSSSELNSTIRSLTGKDPVLLDSQPETLKTRYSYTRGCSLSAEFITRRFSGCGYAPQFHSYFGSVLNSISADGQGTILTSGESGRIFFSSDGGSSFSRPPALTTVELFSALTTSPETLLVAGESGSIFTSFDRGSSWVKGNRPYGYTIMGLAFDRYRTFWAGGDGGLILKSTDGGLNWQVSVWVSRIIRGISFADSLKGWAVGDGGQIIATKNGGRSWSYQASGTTDRLFSLDFVDSLRGWACGSNGAVLSTVNGGSSWTLQRVGGSQWFSSIDFVDSLRGWVVGGKGDLFRTTDGGTTWVRLASGATNYLNSVSFVDSLTGWIAGWGLLLETKDGGMSWIPKEDLLPEKWRNVYATHEGTTNPSRYVFVTAHYDSYSNDPVNLAPGADDNSSGTSTVMELARVMKNYRFKQSVRFILFSGEEQWLMGSGAYARSLSSQETLVAVINMDMLAWGSESLTVYGHPRDPWLLETCSLVESLYTPDLPIFPRADSTFIYSDHSSFWKLGYPAILAIEKDFPENHNIHSANDIFENLNQTLHLKASRFAISLVSHLAVPESLVTGVPLASISKGFSLSSFPNPSRGELHVRLAVYEGPREVHVLIIDAMGRVVRKIWNEMLPTGDYTFSWDGHDERGKRIPSGQYILFARTGERTESKKIMIVR